MNLNGEMESRPARKQRSMVCGIGLNDAPFATSMRVNGKLYQHTAYKDWSNMIKRCYSGRYPAYKNVTVDKQWYSFMNFYSWWADNYHEGYSLDKDLLSGGNKMYGPKNCIYIPAWLNNYLATKNNFRRGVTFDKNLGKYKAQRSVKDSRGRYIGYFLTEQDAYNAWISENNFPEDFDNLDTYIKDLVSKKLKFLS